VDEVPGSLTNALLTPEEAQSIRAPGGTDAAVLLAMFGHPDRPGLVFTERREDLRRHAGEISFPGGRKDSSDADLAATALREAHEEIGLERGWAEVLGQMPIYTTGTRFFVTPVVALVQPDYRLQLNAFEVADAFEVPLDFLMNPAPHRRHAIEFAGARREWFSMPYLDGTQERFIWGATAAILRNFYRFLSA